MENIKETSFTEIEPLQNIEWNLSLEGRVSNACHRTHLKSKTIVQSIRDLQRVVDFRYVTDNVGFYRQMRDKAQLNKHKMYYHNKIKAVFSSAYRLLSDMDEPDEQYFGLKRVDIRELLDKKKVEYEVDTYRKTLLNKTKLTKI